MYKPVEHRTVGQKLADIIASAAGSWTFVLLHAIWFFVWFFFEIEPFPYNLLTMILSLEAIFLSTFILISQNRQSQRDRLRAEKDLETDKAAKREIETLMTRLNAIEKNKLDKILRLLENKKPE